MLFCELVIWTEFCLLVRLILQFSGSCLMFHCLVIPSLLFSLAHVINKLY